MLYEQTYLNSNPNDITVYPNIPKNILVEITVSGSEHAILEHNDGEIPTSNNGTVNTISKRAMRKLFKYIHNCFVYRHRKNGHPYKGSMMKFKNYTFRVVYNKSNSDSSFCLYLVTLATMVGLDGVPNDIDYFRVYLKLSGNINFNSDDTSHKYPLWIGRPILDSGRIYIIDPSLDEFGHGDFGSVYFYYYIGNVYQ
ncbi:hypothetical protein [Microcystis phage Mel-JY01]